MLLRRTWHLKIAQKLTIAAGILEWSFYCGLLLSDEKEMTKFIFIRKIPITFVAQYSQKKKKRKWKVDN